jgi:hypothetical protein
LDLNGRWRAREDESPPTYYKRAATAADIGNLPKASASSMNVAQVIGAESDNEDVAEFIRRLTYNALIALFTGQRGRPDIQPGPALR